ncbi:8418_t:CDS:2 [Entrophospora sp. SA101]|nr:8418_t:CDS:2 [Entrophospora sp. SA101]
MDNDMEEIELQEGEWGDDEDSGWENDLDLEQEKKFEKYPSIPKEAHCYLKPDKNREDLKFRNVDYSTLTCQKYPDTFAGGV